MSLPGFVFYCEHGGNCKWQGFALHKGLGWGKIPKGTDWHQWHVRECGGTLAEVQISAAQAGTREAPAPSEDLEAAARAAYEWYYDTNANEGTEIFERLRAALATLPSPPVKGAVEKAAREYVAAHRAAGTARFQGQPEEAFDAGAAEDAAWTNLCVAVDGWKPSAQGSAGEAPALEGAASLREVLEVVMGDGDIVVGAAIQKSKPHPHVVTFHRASQAYPVGQDVPQELERIADQDMLLLRFKTPESVEVVEKALCRLREEMLAQGSQARSAPSSPRGSNPSKSPEIKGGGAPGGEGG
jgi:hypothetical protein